MAREVQILTWCDNCLATDGSQVEATEQVGLNSSGVKVLVDLCGECTEALLLPSMLTFDAYGRVEPKKRKTKKVVVEQPAGMPCDQPGCERVLGSAQSLGMHKYRSHGIESPHRNKGKVA